MTRNLMIRESSPFVVPDKDAPEGSPEWTAYWHVQAMDAVKDATYSSEILRNTLTKMEASGAFRNLHDNDGRPFLFWEDYCRAAQPHGLGYEPSAIEGIIRERESAATIDVKDKAMQRSSGRPGKTVYDIHDYQRPSGTSSARDLRRLRKDRPDLHAEVLAGNLTPHAAAIVAGFRPKTVAVPLTIKGAVTLLGKLSASDRVDVARSMGWQP